MVYSRLIEKVLESEEHSLWIEEQLLLLDEMVKESYPWNPETSIERFEALANMEVRRLYSKVFLNGGMEIIQNGT